MADETSAAHSRRSFLAGTAIGMFGAPLAAKAAAQPGPEGGADPVLRELRRGNILSHRSAAPSRDGGGDAAAFTAAFQEQSTTRPYIAPDGGAWGIGKIRFAKGRYEPGPIGFGGLSQLGMDLGGDAPYATTLDFSIREGAALSLRTYVNVHVHDLSLRNRSPATGSSVGIALDGEGGGGSLSLDRLVIEGFHTAISNKGDVIRGVASPGNGDKALVSQCVLGSVTAYDQTRNNQAIGWTFVSCASGCSGPTFRLGGAGETLIVSHTADVRQSLIKFPEGSGNPGSGARNYLGSRTTVMSTKLEYHDHGDRMLLDARESLLATDAGGSNCDVVFRETSIASGGAWPDPRSHVIIQVGNEQSGSDAIRLKQEGGFIEGVIKVGSAQEGVLSRRWSFRDAVRAPDPATVQFLGRGSHYLMEWRANENVPLDQYRGGQAFVGAIDAQKAYLWRHTGRALVNTGVAAEAYAGRRGGQFTIKGFPPKMSVMGLAVFIDRNRLNSDTQVEWFADAAFTRPIGSRRIGGDERGLRPVVMNDPAAWQTLSAGELYVRITKPGANDDGTEGALVVFYFPYMGV